VIDAIKVVRSQWQESKDLFRTVADYDVTNVSKKVLRIVMSYVAYVDRTVWRRMPEKEI
jgi:UDP-N-acetylglucosamine 2-epimerase (non-hydrolysing)